MTDVRRYRMALHDMQGRVESSKLGMFSQAIDEIAALRGRLAEVEKERDDLAECLKGADARNLKLGASLQDANAALATARRDALEEAALRIEETVKEAIRENGPVKSSTDKAVVEMLEAIAAAIRALKDQTP